MDADWLPFHPNPRKPKFQVPQGAVDATAMFSVQLLASHLLQKESIPPVMHQKSNYLHSEIF